MSFRPAYILPSFAIIAYSDAVGYLDSKLCVDSAGFENCLAEADSWLSACINKNCAGGDDACTKACGGDVNCMAENCPNLGSDCVSACECTQYEKEIACVSQSCWNQVYSCEYQQTVGGFIDACTNPDLEHIPFWPPPDNAPASCSCNLGKIDSLTLQTSTLIDNCGARAQDDVTNPVHYEDLKNVCLCCAESYALSSIWDTCPETQPSLLHADTWLSILPSDLAWGDCGKYLEQYDCAKMVDFGNETTSKALELYAPGKFPSNGTATLYNIDGTISSPVSGATFTWQNKDVPRTIVAASADGRAGAKTTTTASKSTSSMASDTAATSISPTSASTGKKPEGRSIWFLLSAIAVWHMSFWCTN